MDLDQFGSNSDSNLSFVVQHSGVAFVPDHEPSDDDNDASFVLQQLEAGNDSDSDIDDAVPCPEENNGAQGEDEEIWLRQH